MSAYILYFFCHKPKVRVSILFSKFLIFCCFSFVRFSSFRYRVKALKGWSLILVLIM